MQDQTTHDGWTYKSYAYPEDWPPKWVCRRMGVPYPHWETPPELKEWPGPDTEEIPGLLESLTPGHLVNVKLRCGKGGSAFMVPGFQGLAMVVSETDHETRFVHARSGRDLSSENESPFDIVEVI